jgi:hypothetical protein
MSGMTPNQLQLRGQQASPATVVAAIVLIVLAAAALALHV